MSDFCLYIVIYITHLIVSAHSTLATELPYLCFTLDTASLSSVSAFTIVLVACVTNNRSV